MAVAKLKRPMYGPGSNDHERTIGKDVQIAKFGIARYPNSGLPIPSGGFTKTFGQQMKEAVQRIQRKEGIQSSGNIGQETWPIIWQYLDAYRRLQYRNWDVPSTWQETAWVKLIAAMEAMDRHTPGYLLGGGHGIPLSQVSVFQRLDCSSSTSKALYEADLFEGRDYAIVSEAFNDWGEAGTGNYFTVYCNVEHVWTRLHKSTWWRFDTSPHGDGGSGPQLRFRPRFSGGFSARHFPGM